MNKDNQTPVPGQEPENEIRQQDVSDVTEEKVAETEKAEMPEDNTPKAEAHGKKKHRGVSRKFRYGTLSTVLTLVVVAACLLYTSFLKGSKKSREVFTTRKKIWYYT